MATTLREYLDKVGVLTLWDQMKAFIVGKKYAGGTADGGTANKAASIPFGTVDSTSTATAFTATVDGITELRDGVSLYLKNTVVTSAAATTAPKCWTLNINNLGAKPVYVTTAAATYSTTHFTKNYKMLFTYDESLNSGNGGWYIGQLYNTNTTYSDMTQAEIDAGTGTTGRKITPKMLRDNFYTEDEVDDLLGSKANSNDLATVATSGSYNDLDDTPTIPAAVTETTVSNWGFTKNTGTVTGVKMNGTTKGTSGLVDLGTVLTEHQDISGKQDVISDLATIRSGASAGATAYQKPSGGIPKTDLASAVQASLGKADSALQTHQDISGKADVSALAGYTPTSGFATINGASITGGGNVQIVAAEGQTITIDATPTSGSSNAVSSGGVFDAIEGGFYY